MIRNARAVLAAALLVVAFVEPAAADAATVTRGHLHAFAAGASLELAGRAQMIRTADGKTIVTIHVMGLAPDTAYGVHVHGQACGMADAGGHYRFDPAGPAAPPNEIWPGFTTDAAGVGNGKATVDGTAGPTAAAVVIHAPGGAKIACADLA